MRHWFHHWHVVLEPNTGGRWQRMNSHHVKWYYAIFGLKCDKAWKTRTYHKYKCCVCGATKWKRFRDWMF